MPVFSIPVAAPHFFFSKLLNRLKRFRGPSLADKCAALIMRVCTLQLERNEIRTLAPTKGAVGPMELSGGAITKVVYYVFDKNADDIDPSIKEESQRAFLRVTTHVTLSLDPQFKTEVQTKDLEWVETPSKDMHKAPGLALITHLFNYFPLHPKPHTGPTLAPEVE